MRQKLAATRVCAYPLFMPSVTIIGIHPFDYTDEQFDHAVTQSFGLVALDPDRNTREFAEYATRRSLQSIVLIEMLVRGRDKTMYIGDFGQSDNEVIGPNDPVAYEEVFLSLDGAMRIGDYLDQVKGDDIRFAFYLHGYRPGMPILTTYGPVQPPPLTPMPARLKHLVPYKLPEND